MAVFKTGDDSDDNDLLRPPRRTNSHMSLGTVHAKTFKGAGCQQGSLLSILTMYNLGMGPYLLLLPWAVSEAGPIPAMVLIPLMACCNYYSTCMVMDSPNTCDAYARTFPDVCKQRLGNWAKNMALWTGTIAAYIDALVNFLTILGITESWAKLGIGTYTEYLLRDSSVVCGERIKETAAEEKWRWQHSSWWFSGYNSSEIFHPAPHYSERVISNMAPIFLAVGMIPMLAINNIVVLNKVSTSGILASGFLVAVAVLKMDMWNGFNYKGPGDMFYFNIFGIFRLVGQLTIAFFIHNVVLSVLRNAKDKTKNRRNIAVSYSLVSIVYTFFGVIMFMSFPEDKGCIRQTILDNFKPTDILVLIAKAILTIQMTSVFLVYMYEIRETVLHAMYGRGETKDNVFTRCLPKTDFTDESDEYSVAQDAEIVIVRESDSRTPCDEDLMSDDPMRSLDYQAVLSPGASTQSLYAHRRAVGCMSAKFLWSVITNILLLGSFVVFAIFYRNPGDFAAIGGSLVGLVYASFLPYAVYWETASVKRRVFFVVMMIMGVLTFIFNCLYLMG